MTKIAYIEKSFNDATLLIIDQANKIIKKYEAEGMNLTLRQLYYQFISGNLLENKQDSYRRLGKIISNARLTGLVDWSAIKDLTRNLRGTTHWTNPGQIVRAAARGFCLDHWEGQKYKPEVWIEKEALIGVIENICRELDVDYFACKGYVSQSEMWSASQRFELVYYNGQTPIIIHLGDHDPSGIDMTRDIFDRQDLFLKDIDCPVERIALNMDQINKYDPPPNPAKLTDSRSEKYVQKYGNDSWELDALEPVVLRDLIKKAVLKYRDDNIYNDVLKQEREYLNILAKVEKNWQTL